MPRKYTRRSRTRKGKKSRRMMPRTRSYAKSNSDFARLVYNIPQEFALNATTNGSTGSSVVFADNFSLTNSIRAMTVAQAYQEYRIARVDMFVKPNADTFDSQLVATGANAGVPYFYYLIDKTGTLTNSTTTTATLKQAGAKPIRLDGKTIKISWKPSVMIGSQDQAGGPAPVSELVATYKISPWITTNANASESGSVWQANSVDHLGIVFGAEQPRGPLPTSVASITYRLTFEFRKPQWVSPAPAPGSEPQHLDLDVLGNDFDASRKSEYVKPIAK